MAKSLVEVNLIPIEATSENFAEYGQVIEVSRDGERFGPNDAQLDLSKGTPRFYLMTLNDAPLRLSSITHHANVTQCLGSIGGHVWYLGVAKPSIIKNDDDVGKGVDNKVMVIGTFLLLLKRCASSESRDRNISNSTTVPGMLDRSSKIAPWTFTT